MECLKKTVKSKKVQDLFRLPNSFLDYDELEIIITPIISCDLSERKKLAKRDIDIINANADRLNKDAEENSGIIPNVQQKGCTTSYADYSHTW
jgi:hypothetical protein